MYLQKEKKNRIDTSRNQNIWFCSALGSGSMRSLCTAVVYCHIKKGGIYIHRKIRRTYGSYHRLIEFATAHICIDGTAIIQFVVFQQAANSLLLIFNLEFTTQLKFIILCFIKLCLCTKKGWLCFVGIEICCVISLTKAQCLYLLRYFHFSVSKILSHSPTPPFPSSH